MDWIHTKRRGPEWKRGLNDQTLSSISAPPLPLLAIFAIVIFLLSLSQYSTYKEQMSNTVTNFKILLILLPLFLIFFVRSNLVSGSVWAHLWAPSRQGQQVRRGLGRGVSGFPWGVAVVLVALLVLVSYQSSFHSKWFPFGRSD